MITTYVDSGDVFWQVIFVHKLD